VEIFILWFWGAAGAGKSAIAQSLAELCEEQNLLLGSFFFSRNAPYRGNSLHLFASLAYQIVRAIPEIGGLVGSAVERDPLIFHQSLETQYATLIAYPLRHFLEQNSTEHLLLPRLVIIDGLDECTDGTQRQILDVILKVTRRFSLPLLFLVASRPERDISSFFNMPHVRRYLPASLSIQNTDRTTTSNDSSETKYPSFATPILSDPPFPHLGLQRKIYIH